MKKNNNKRPEKSIDTIMLENGNKLVSPYYKNEWEKFVANRDYKNTDVQYTYICLELLNKSNLCYNELSSTLKSLTVNEELKTIDIAYPIYKASQFSVFGEELKQECISMFGNINSREELENVIILLESKGKKKYRKR